MPWSKTGKSPDMNCVNAVFQLVHKIQPRYWVLENVRGAVPYLGLPTRRIGSVYLWGRFPLFLASPSFHKMKWHGRDAAGRLRRAMIPEQIPVGLAMAIEAEIAEEKKAT